MYTNGKLENSLALAKLLQYREAVPHSESRDLSRLETTTMLSFALLSVENRSYLRLGIECFIQIWVRHLKTVDEPFQYSNGELIDCTNCAQLLKDSVENIEIVERPGLLNFAEIKKVHSDVLFANLHEIKNLTTLCFAKDTIGDIHTLERILNNCRSLKELDFDFNPSNRHLLIDNCTPIAIETIPTLNSSPNIKNLNSHVFMTPDCKIVSYKKKFCWRTNFSRSLEL